MDKLNAEIAKKDFNIQKLQHALANQLKVMIKFFTRLYRYDQKAIVYCKRGYFCWGKISRKLLQDISCGGNFHDATPVSFIKAYGFYFHVGLIFAKNTKAQKT